MATEFGDLIVETSEPDDPSKDHPILFIHGMWEGAWFWRNYLDFFASHGHACFALNLRGHHGSRPVPDFGKVTINDYIADAREVAAAVGNPILVGHSMGGLLVQKLAEMLDPPAVVAITPAAPRGIFALNTVPLLKAALRHSPEIFLGRPLMLSKEEMIHLELNRLPAEEQDRVYANQVPESGRQTFDIAVVGLRVDAAKVQCPMLVISGSEDRITPPKMVRKIAQRYGAEYREFSGFAHMIVLEPGWERVAEEIVGWLEGAVLGSERTTEPGAVI